jgi:nucleotide-binding universal stress UspA family protein
MSAACSILVPVDGSENSSRAVRFAIRLHRGFAPLGIYLLYVRVPSLNIPDDPRRGEPDHAIPDHALASAKAMLDAAGVPYSSDVARGFVGSTIVAYAREHGCESIVMGTRGMGSTGELLGSIARQVVLLAEVPVTLVK